MKLLALDPDCCRAVAAGDFQPLIAGTGRAPTNIDALGPTLVEIAKACCDLYAHNQSDGPWICYLAVSGDRLIGTCGFKSRPCDGTVEIAYFTFPDFEGRGWGKRMAQALIDIAWREPGVMLVTAHTLRKENASTGILRRLGFDLKGTLIDPEDGPVWRWHLWRKALAA
jgi:RimJ/RimL family protein N-acetyltransferase